MNREQLKINQQVRFGKVKPSLGEIVKFNLKTATIKALEPRKSAAAGELWHVPYSMIYATNDKPPKPQPLTYNAFDEVENFILQAIVALYGKLDNPTCDGEATNFQMVMYFKRLHETQLKHLQDALGRTVTEEQAYKWDEQRKKENKK